MLIQLILGLTSFPALILATPGEDQPHLVRGQCLDATDQKTIEDCVVQARWFSAHIPKNKRVGEWILHSDNWHSKRLRTDREGNFEFSIPNPAERIELVVHGKSRGYASACAVFPASSLTLDPINLPKGHRLTGRVIQERNQPLPDAVICILNLPLTVSHKGEPLSPGARVTARTDVEGRYEANHLIPPGRFRAALLGKSATLVGPKNFEFADEDRNVSFLVRRKPTVSGRVVDPSGRPVSGIRVSHQIQGCITDPMGRFRLVNQNDEEQALIEIRPSLKFQPLVKAQAYEWGQDNIEIQVRPCYRQPIQVLREGSDEPVLDYEITSFPMGQSVPWESTRKPCPPPQDGTMIIEGIFDGDNVCCVYPNDPSLLPFRWTLNSDDISQEPQVIRVKPLNQARFQIFDFEGDPLSLANVAVYDLSLVDGKKVPLRMGQGRTDKVGQIQIHTPRGRDFELRVAEKRGKKVKLHMIRLMVSADDAEPDVKVIRLQKHPRS